MIAVFQTLDCFTNLKVMGHREDDQERLKVVDNSTSRPTQQAVGAFSSPHRPVYNTITKFILNIGVGIKSCLSNRLNLNNSLSYSNGYIHIPYTYTYTYRGWL